MQNMKISLVNADLLAIACSVAFIKHGEDRMWGPERAIDLKLNGRLTSLYRDNESLDHIIINTEGIFPFPFLYIINFRQEDMPFNYSTVDTFARKIIRLAESDARTTKIATTIHGPGLGLDASESLETMLTAFASEIRSRGISSNLEEIVLIEKSPRALQQQKSQSL